MRQREAKLGRVCVLAVLALVGAGLAPAGALGQSGAWVQDDTLRGARATISPEQIKTGMKGYGLTVFHGANPEPFAVEVVSVEQDFSPDRGVVWVRCPDERMQKSGPVQGMSGSPIYLWGEGEPQVLGKGGKLVGAFAFGFGSGKDCFVGVQPIGYMRDVAGRVRGELKAKADAGEGASAGGLSASDAARGASGAGLATLDRLNGMYHAREGMPDQGYVARAIAKILSGGKPTEVASARREGERTSPTAAREFANVRGEVSPLTLPVRFSTPAIAQAVRPLFEPMGMTAYAGGVTVTGRPPDGIDPASIKFEPGSTLTIPLAWGPLDVAAIGTVTDVLPDGRVLAFGHSMLGQGAAAFPMATGYVHFVQPSLGVSFKVGGSAAIQGTIHRDERTGIVGSPVKSFATTPLTITVNMPAQKPAVFKYQVANIKNMMAPVVIGVILESINSAQSIPLENTVRLRGVLKFEGNRQIDIDTMLVHEDAKEDRPDTLVMNLLPPIAALMQNQHQSLMLTEVTLTADIVPSLQIATIGNVRLDRAHCMPGEKVGMTVRVHPFGKAAFDKRIELPVPESTPEGDYMLVVCDPSSYLQSIIMSKPHLLATTNVDDLLALVKKVMTVKSDGIYAVLFLAEEGVVVGHREMPSLPSSKRALLAAPAVTNVTPFTQTIERAVSTGLLCSGGQMFSLSVRKNPRKN